MGPPLFLRIFLHEPVCLADGFHAVFRVGGGADLSGVFRCDDSAADHDGDAGEGLPELFHGSAELRERRRHE